MTQKRQMNTKPDQNQAGHALEHELNERFLYPATKCPNEQYIGTEPNEVNKNMCRSQHKKGNNRVVARMDKLRKERQKENNYFGIHQIGDKSLKIAEFPWKNFLGEVWLPIHLTCNLIF